MAGTKSPGRGSQTPGHCQSHKPGERDAFLWRRIQLYVGVRCELGGVLWRFCDVYVSTYLHTQVLASSPNLQPSHSSFPAPVEAAGGAREEMEGKGGGALG